MSTRARRLPWFRDPPPPITDPILALWSDEDPAYQPPTEMAVTMTVMVPAQCECGMFLDGVTAQWVQLRTPEDTTSWAACSYCGHVSEFIEAAA